MSKNSINQMLAGLEADLKAGMGENESPKASAAERLGRALLDSFGAVEGMNEDELVDALLGEWSSRQSQAGETEKAEPREPFEPALKPPVPMKAGVSAPQPMNYADMPAKQFNELKKLLKKAAMDGKRMKI
ncbi:MAG: hypothetical protein K6F68_01040 [Clostridiales bacterium]|nr:hypothetical protein [Clostridiales bacterium]